MKPRNDTAINRNNHWLAVAALVAFGFALVEIAVELLA